MQSRPDLGALLTMLARLANATRAVEVGTFTGYGAVCIARGLAPGGQLTCFEVERAATRRSPARTSRARVADRVTSRSGARGRAPARPPAGRLRLHRRRQGRLPRLLRGAGPAPAPRRRARPRQHAAGATRCSTRRTRRRARSPRSTSGSRADERVDSVLLEPRRRRDHRRRGRLISRFRIFPVGPFGSSSENQIWRGYL